MIQKYLILESPTKVRTKVFCSSKGSDFNWNTFCTYLIFNRSPVTS